MAGLLLASPDAHAGSYTVSYSGGTVSVTGTGGANGTPYPFSQGQGMYAASESAGTGSYSNPTAASYSIKINGSLTATFTWVHGSGQTDANDPPPACALVE